MKSESLFSEKNNTFHAKFLCLVPVLECFLLHSPEWSATVSLHLLSAGTICHTIIQLVWQRLGGRGDYEQSGIEQKREFTNAEFGYKVYLEMTQTKFKKLSECSLPNKILSELNCFYRFDLSIYEKAEAINSERESQTK
jgi:hypothetical protein